MPPSVRAPSAGVPSNFELEVHAQDSSGCRRIRLFYNQDAYNQEVYVTDGAVQNTHNMIVEKKKKLA